MWWLIGAAMEVVEEVEFRPRGGERERGFLDYALVAKGNGLWEPRHIFIVLIQEPNPITIRKPLWTGPITQVHNTLGNNPHM